MMYIERREKSPKRERLMSVVWDDDSEVFISIPLKDLTEELYQSWKNVFGFAPVGRMEEYVKFE